MRNPRLQELKSLTCVHLHLHLLPTLSALSSPFRYPQPHHVCFVLELKKKKSWSVNLYACLGNIIKIRSPRPACPRHLALCFWPFQGFHGQHNLGHWTWFTFFLRGSSTYLPREIWENGRNVPNWGQESSFRLHKAPVLQPHDLEPQPPPCGMN